MNIPAASYFSADYVSAADRFHNAAYHHGYNMALKYCKGVSRTGGSLYIDIARKGPIDAPRVLITTSGTHGVEGFAGSAIQLSAIENELLESKLPRDMAIVHVHALNPYGFSYLRRTDEQNIDLNRNCIDWEGKKIPKDPPHTAFVQPMFHPSKWQWPIPELANFIQTTPKEISDYAIAGGQYTDPRGLFYGGSGPSQSNIIWQEIIREHLWEATRIIHLDFHTGLGPFGHGELIVPAKPGDPMLDYARACWGNRATSPFDGSSAAGKITGFMNAALDILKPRARIISAALEFGTYEPHVVLEALAFDNYVESLPLTPDNVKEYWNAKDKIKGAFCPPDGEWKKAVIEQGQKILLDSKHFLMG
jgi:hypothetical protein